jgi:hypothetical protein
MSSTVRVVLSVLARVRTLHCSGSSVVYYWTVYIVPKELMNQSIIHSFSLSHNDVHACTVLLYECQSRRHEKY